MADKKTTSSKIVQAKKTKAKKAAAVKKKRSIELKDETLLSPPKGMHDVLPASVPFWEKIENETKSIADFYNFSKIETPILEKLELFRRSIGEATDIVEKEMYILRTKGGDRLALRPDMTAPIMRSYISNGLHRLPQPQRFYYFGPLFRHERPQAGRYRQFHQIGFEIIGGEADPVYDAEIINVFYRLAEELKIKNLVIQLNSIGCRVCRPNYRKKLVDYYRDKPVCRDCLRRIKLNPLRLLDCKKEGCQLIRAKAPSVLDYLCSHCRHHFKQVLEYLEELNLPYSLNPFLVRGLDYYNRTVFELFVEGDELALAGGGRYDYLAEVLGWRPTPGVGGALGVERLIELLQLKQPNLSSRTRSKVFLIHVGELAKKRSLSLTEELRLGNIPVVSLLGKSSLSGQLEAANKMGASLALILGQKEVYEGTIIIRNMETGVQESVPLTKAAEEIRKRLRPSVG
jgi:histidyl-tRNA synthetase